MSSGAVSAEEGTMGEISMSSQGKINIEGPRVSSINIDSNGSVATQSSNYVVRSDEDLSMGVGNAGEFKIIHNASRSTGQVNFRVRENKVISHVPIQTPEVSSPSDERIKREIVDVDGEDLLLRLQAIEVKSYKYTEAWRAVRGIDDVETRGVIAQQVKTVFPEYVKITDNLVYEDKNFQLDNFHEVNKIKMAIDTLAALQAQYKRFTISRLAGSTSSIDINTAVSEVNTATSGDVRVRTGESFTSASGSLNLETGSAFNGEAGNINLQGGAGMVQGGGVSLVGGSSTDGLGGALKLASGLSSTSASGTVVMSSGQSAGQIGDVVLSSGTSSSLSGSMSLTTGRGDKGSGGILMQAGDAANDGGNIVLAAGRASVRDGGNMTLTSGSGGARSGSLSVGTSTSPNGQSVGIDLFTGNSIDSISGEIAVSTGHSANSQAGGFSLNLGDSSKLENGAALSLMSGRGGLSGGKIQIRAGDTSGDSPASNGGGVEVAAGSSPKGVAGHIVLAAGQSSGGDLGKGGKVSLAGGSAAAGRGGDADIVAGQGAGGGDVNIRAGGAASETGGRVQVLSGAVLSTSGSSGMVLLGSCAGSPQAVTCAWQLAALRSRAVTLLSAQATHRRTAALWTSSEAHRLRALEEP